MRSRKRRSLGSSDMSHEAVELQLYIDNDRPLYRQKEAIRTNLTKHYCRGQFDNAKAAKGFSYVTDAGARKYTKEFGSPGDRIFDRSARNEVNANYVSAFKRDLNYCVTNAQCNDLSSEQVALLKSKKCKISTPLAGPRRRR